MTDFSRLPKLGRGFWYLASPYSKYADGIERAWRDICVVAGKLIAAKVPVYCPIAHTHPIAVYSYMDPLKHDIWLPADEPMMRAADGLLVCMMPGWQESYGIGLERAEFERLGKPAYFLTYPELAVLRHPYDH